MTYIKLSTSFSACPHLLPSQFLMLSVAYSAAECDWHDATRRKEGELHTAKHLTSQRHRGCSISLGTCSNSVVSVFNAGQVLLSMF